MEIPLILSRLRFVVDDDLVDGKVEEWLGFL